MAKVSPIIRSFNAGEQSPLMDGRTDIASYPASSRTMLNVVAAPQGPAICRSGTEFVAGVYNNAQESSLIPFVFSETDFYMLEFANSRVRFLTETGVLTYAKVAMTVTDASPFEFDSATLGASIGDEVAFSDFPNNYNLNGVIGKITNKVGTVYTVDTTHPALALLATAKVARVYHITSPYTSAQAQYVVDVPSLDVVYLFHPTIKTYKLQRSNTYSWALTAVTWVDGPYMPTNEEKTTLKPSVTGKATPDMTSATLPSGTASASSEVVGFEAWKAWDSPNDKTWWQCNVDQVGWLQYQSSVAFVCDGYSIQMATDNTDTSYTSKDFAPSDFTLLGSNNGVTFTMLNKQNNYVLYEANKSVFFKIPNTTAYLYYRLEVDSCMRNGALKPKIRSLVLRSTNSVSMTITASAMAGINNNTGFQTTDIGRLIRMKANDGTWRQLVITARTNTTVVTATLLGEPFPDLQETSEWRLGAWSDTTGYPNTAVFFQDRLWMGGSVSFPDLLCASNTGLYENMTPSTDKGEVLDTNGIAIRLNSRRLSRIKWMAGGKDGLMLGTGSQEYIAKAGGVTGNTKTITPGNITVDDSSSRGSSDTPVVVVDKQVLYVQRSGRTLREYAYSYESDGYKSPSMSILASHLGISPFVQMAYAAEPYSIVWVRRSNGSLIGLTYNREESVVGWHRHGFQDEEVERIAVLPSTDQLQDVLWMVIKRTVDGNVVRYIEKLTKFWDFGMTLDDAHYVDCALRYSGEAISTVYGLQHLEGRTIYGLADNIPVGPFVVTDGAVTLVEEAENIVLGLGFDSEGETSSLENGAQDGTAQGKEKRMNAFTLKVWDSYGGEVGTYNEDTNAVEYVNLADEYPQGDASLLETIELFTGIIGPFTPAPGYEKRGSVFFRRKKEVPLPFNITSLMPQMTTQDRG